MATLLDDPDLLASEDQTAFNLAVWQKVLADEFLRSLPHRIETDHVGQIIISPPPFPQHGSTQFWIGMLLQQMMKGGTVITECAVSTTGGVKGVDVAWISQERREPQRTLLCFTSAPEICVEVISPNNTAREMSEKRGLYFEAGADEVWFCHRDGRMEFFLSQDQRTPCAASQRCPAFPAHVTAP